MLIEGLYSVIETNTEENTLYAKVKLNKDHEVFEGHFPGNPVMPGVCMIQMIKELTEEQMGQDLFLTTASNIKFMAIINPEKNETIDLQLNISENEGLVKVKTTVSFEETMALKLSATFKIVA
ncbi:MAG: 3-hydroxyacyl-ACP dehydratase [Pseudozobellia sp.]|nr:3-hydroxyacyl-ACP dehydratase [Pseudozobellia sp.]MBG47896.1 3-hydroxyacyl-ACP dehydratase [Pseudozobellia sp.]|tara:strand:- start:182 stop:550 length:369 start_codon:yes stop_codon:yes gene_type:complete